VRQERLYRAEGIVLREVDYAEVDRILTLLTPGGKLVALARGIRRITSRRAGHLGLFHRARIMLARGHNMDIVTQAECLEEFEGIRGDLLRFTYACYVGELAERFAQEGEDNQPLYELMVHTLRQLSQERDPRLWVRYFELRLLANSGYRPELFTCAQCHEPIRPVVNFFSLAQGGVLCSHCGQSQPEAKAVSVNGQKVLRYLQTHEPAEVNALTLAESTHSEVESLLQSYLEFTIERELKSAAFLQRLRRELRAAEKARPSATE
jgi:DNA repair protein RecO (recombination protein O)